MKAFLTRLNRGLAGGREKDREKDAQAPKEKIPQLPPLREWPPSALTSTPNSINSFKPLPELSVRPLPPIGEPSSSSTESSLTTTPVAANPPLPATETKENLPAVPEPTPPFAPASEGHQSTRADGSTDSTGRSSRKAANGTSSDAQKKVAFLSPPPTPAPLQDRALPDADTPTPTPTPTVAVKSSVSRFHAAHGKETRGSTSTAASSRTDVASTLKSTKPASTRTATSPYSVKGYEASLHQSLRSTTPFSQMSNTSSRILAAQSWSEGAEEDLVTNLGQRERTRQEVLWEIVASEERYVTELLKMKETFIEPLLHPYIASPVSSPTPMDIYDDLIRADTPRESLEHLPIAARFLGSPDRSDSPAPITETARKEDNHPNIDGESMDSAEEDEAEDRMGAAFHSSRQKTVTMSLAAKHNHPRSPYGTTAARSGKSKFGTSVPFPTRSHQSLPPPPRTNLMTSSTHSLGRQSFVAESQREYEHSPPSMRTTGTGASRVLRKFKKSTTGPDTIAHGAVPPAQIPEDLRKCLEVIEGGILDGHIRLSEGLRKRYEDQYPLVRSLADVFVTNSHILHGYATYVLHLERALEQVDNALSTASKKPKKQDADQWLKICQYLQKLEITASEKGETGLAISLSKPFQRLLKYPLLFQNLLYHTDPSTFEYESTLQMVAEVETIVRSIEDEKIQKEERDKTRDVFARIESLDKVKQLMVPKPSRVLVEERPVVGVNPLTDPTRAESSRFTASPPLSSQNSKNVKGKTSFKRLSDVLQSGSSGIGGKKDLWLVVFNDVVLRCQRTGTTSLPLVSGSANSRANSLPELQGKAKYATTGRRGPTTKPRNLYKFLKIETWDIGDVVQPREGVVSMEEVAKSRQQVHTAAGVQPRIVPMPTEAEEEEAANDSDDSDRKSKMSFSYWGADKVTLQKPIVKPKAPMANGGRRTVTPTTAYARESSANAKFGTRLIQDAPHQVPRPASRRTVATPVNRKVTPHSDEGHSVKVTITRDRPTWDRSTRATTTPLPNKRARNVSQTSAATRVTTTPNTNKTLASPAPSEDSGVGFIRNMVNQNPSLNRLIP